MLKTIFIFRIWTPKLEIFGSLTNEANSLRHQRSPLSFFLFPVQTEKKKEGQYNGSEVSVQDILFREGEVGWWLDYGY